MSGGYEGRPRLGHHFDDQVQQYEANKLGMWIFLMTEILLFGGLFCAYAVYRASHPEIFVYADHFLDRTLGAINTIVLLFSSLTMAWAVRAAQLGQRRLLVALLSITIVCAFAFLGIKRIEYAQKWRHGLLWGERFRYEQVEHRGEEAGTAAATGTPAVPPPAPEAGASASAGDGGDAGTTLPRAGEAPAGLAAPAPPGGAARAAVGDVPRNVHIFFGIYFVMTGLHALHVIAGIVVIVWLLVRAVKGEFGRRYFTPVDLGGLYWHLVDVIWIFLFPLLYLIH